MGLQIGRVAALFGLTPETLRYYENEGLLSPFKNPQNGYREYSFQDLLFLTDLMFYRNIGIPIRDIKRIKDGLGMEEISLLIEEKKEEMEEKLRRQQASLTKLNNWLNFHTESVDYYQKYDLRPMPAALRIGSYQRSYEKSLLELQQYIVTEQKGKGAQLLMPEDISFFLTPSFFYDLSQPDPRSLNHYMVLDKSLSQNLRFDFSRADAELTEEAAGRSLFTVVKYSEDPLMMLQPLLDHAAAHGLKLSGHVYGRQSINTYDGHSCTEYYRVYAILQ